MHRLAREEQETTINWCVADSKATIDTADPVVMRKLDKLVDEFPDVYKVERVDPHYNAKMYGVDAKYVRFAKPPSEKKREAARRNGRNGVFIAANSPKGNSPNDKGE